MAALSIRDLDDRVKDRLRVRAAQHGRSMEAEVRAILSAAVREPPRHEGLAEALLSRFSTMGGVDLDLPDRAEVPRSSHVSS